MYNLRVYAGCRDGRPGRPRTPYMASLHGRHVLDVTLYDIDVCWLGQFLVETAKKVQGYGRDV